MFKLKSNQVTFSGLGSVRPVLIVRLHLLPASRELPVTAKQPLCLPGQGGEIYPTHSTWERAWIWLESEGTRRAFLFHLLSHQNPLQTKDSPENKKLLFKNWSRSFKRACSFPLAQTMLRIRHGFMQKDVSMSLNDKEKGNRGLKKTTIIFTPATLWYLVSRLGIATPPNKIKINKSTI